MMNPIKTLIEQVDKTISRYRMINPGDRIVVGISGGPDSVCLLDVLRQLAGRRGIRLVAAHYNHGLRPAEDEAETRFVQGLSESLGLPFEVGNAPSFADRKGRSLEERAREARYEFFEEVKEKHGAQKIALGHNLNDQAETVIMRLLRGSGPQGLAGIPPLRAPFIVRPLIRTKREEIEAYLNARGQSWVLDSSNLDPGFLRNRIRIELLPHLLRYQPRLIEHLGRTAEILREENQYLNLQAEDWVQRNATGLDEEEVVIPLAPFNRASRALRNRIVRIVLEKFRKNLRRVDSSHILAVDRLAMGKRPQGALDLPGTLQVRRIYDRLSFRAGGKRRPVNYQYRLEGLGAVHILEIDRSLSLTALKEGGELNAILSQNKRKAFLDADKAGFPLTVRNFRDGDRFVPLGMAGSKKVKNLFIDLKIPSDERRRTPVMLSGDRIVWVCGLRIDDRFRVTPLTKRILMAAISEP